MGDRPEHRHRGWQRVDARAVPRVTGAQAFRRRRHRRSTCWPNSYVSQAIRRPFEAADMKAIARLYPPPPEYFDTTFLEDRDAIEHKQLRRLIEKAWHAYRIPFH